MMRLRWIFSPVLAMTLVVTACSGDSLVPSREPSSDDPSVEDPSGPSVPDEIPPQDWLSYIDDATYVSRLTIRKHPIKDNLYF